MDELLFSDKHFVGTFWKVEGLTDLASVIAYRVPFSKADVTDDYDMIYPPAATPEMHWKWLQSPEQGLSPAALDVVKGTDHGCWPSGRVVHFRGSGTWAVTMAEELQATKAVRGEVVSLFNIDADKCRFSIDRGMNGRTDAKQAGSSRAGELR